MDAVPDDTTVDNPTRVKARAERTTTKATLVAAQAAFVTEAIHPRCQINDYHDEIRERRNTVTTSNLDPREDNSPPV